jgi:hypothetical protein
VIDPAKTKCIDTSREFYLKRRRNKWKRKTKFQDTQEHDAPGESRISRSCHISPAPSQDLPLHNLVGLPHTRTHAHAHAYAPTHSKNTANSIIAHISLASLFQLLQKRAAKEEHFSNGLTISSTTADLELRQRSIRKVPDTSVFSIPVMPSTCFRALPRMHHHPRQYHQPFIAESPPNHHSTIST